MRTGSMFNKAAPVSTVTPIAPSSDKRVLIRFSVDTGVAYITDLPGAAPGDGFPITKESPLTLCQEDHGDLVRHAFFASSLSGTIQVGVIQIEETDGSKVGNM